MKTDSQTLKPLPLRVRERVFEFARLREHQTEFDRALTAPRKTLTAFSPKRAGFDKVGRHLDAAAASLKMALERHRETVKTVVRRHFATQGIAPGAVIQLTYPVYQVSLDDLTACERLLRRETVTLKVQAFSIRRASSPTDVRLDVVGLPKPGNGRFHKDAKTYCLEPGYEFEVVRAAPVETQP